MGTKDIRIDPELNKELWKKGVRNLQTRIEIIWKEKKMKMKKKVKKK